MIPSISNSISRVAVLSRISNSYFGLSFSIAYSLSISTPEIVFKARLSVTFSKILTNFSNLGPSDFASSSISEVFVSKGYIRPRLL
ncbi:MAG: hypothetical protein ACJ0F0_00860 [Burkholderiaceae bacterium]